MPEEWAGLRGEEFQKITGVHDAIFCHPGAFILGAESKEGIKKLADLVLELKEKEILRYWRSAFAKVI